MRNLKKTIWLVFLVGFIFGLIGCETMKGMSEGFKKDFSVVSKKVTNFDTWFRKNLW